jgi:hypothetical protein
MNMSKSAYHQPDLTAASRDDLEALVTKLVETGRISADVINAELDNIRETTGERAKAASETSALKPEKVLDPESQEALLGTLKVRFETNGKLHENVKWADVEKALRANPEKLWSLQQLESTNGEPDVIAEEEGEFIFGDCSAESPSGRRNVVFDEEAQKYLEENFPGAICNGNAVDMAGEYGVELMDEEQYRGLQKKLRLDRNTWSWLKTPANVRKSGYALYGYRVDNDVYVRQCDALDHGDSGAWRAALRVSKA